MTGSEAGETSERAFQSIRQTDLAPTISILLGLPIPYANLGGLVPSLLPPSHGADLQSPVLALALALNAAQVWRYFSVYSQTATKLPSMPDLEALLIDSVSAYKKALEHADIQDSVAYRETCGKFKVFLMEAAEVGMRVWTRFDTRGMFVGGAILFLSVILGAPIWNLSISAWNALPREQYLEVAVSAALMLFHCVILTFSNSYIDSEQRIVMFALAVICIMLCYRNPTSSHDRKFGKKAASFTESWLPLGVPICSRVGELFVSGHGQDPSIPLHAAHSSAVFLSALAGLAIIRAHLARKSELHVGLDLAVLFLLALVWLDGYVLCSMVLALLTISIPLSAFDLIASRQKSLDAQCVSYGISVLLFNVLVAIMTVTGPSTASSAVLFVIQLHVLRKMSERSGQLKVSRRMTHFLVRGLYVLATYLTANNPFAGFVTSFGSFVEAYDSAYFLRDESCLCFQSTAILGSVCGYGSI